MLRRGRRRRTSNNEGKQDGERGEKERIILAQARAVVQQEIEALRSQLQHLKQENHQQRQIYQHQERALYEELTSCRRQLEQRRDTLLATTPLLPYTHTIQQTATVRVPAPLLTLQARLCLHVHCLCVHEELLLTVKAQGWDTIAWMEDVSKQLRFITKEQVCVLTKQIRETLEELKAATETSIDIPQEILETVQKASDVEAVTPKGNVDTKELIIQDKTPSSAELLDQLPYDQQLQQQQQEKHEDISFQEFLQRYQQRKEAQVKMEQARLDEFRSRGNGNPYNRLSKAQVGHKLKQYATKIFQANNNNSSNHATTTTIMDESFHLGEDGGENTSNTSLSGGRNKAVQPKKWIKKGKNFLSEHYSDSNLDHSLSSLGGSLKGLRLRGRGKASSRAANATNNDGGAGAVVTEEEEGEDGVDKDDDIHHVDNDDEGMDESFHLDDNNNTAEEAKNGNDDNNNNNNNNEDNDEFENSFGHDELLQTAEGIDSSLSRGKDNANDTHEQQQQRGRLSGLKHKLKNRPVVQKFFQSTTW